MKLLGRGGRRGIALTMAIMMIICSTVLAGYALQAGWNMRRISIAGGSKRDKIYYYAKAGVVNARWRVRTDTTAGLAPGGTFTNDAYDPNPYRIDVNGDGNDDVEVNIFPVANGVRQIDSRGLDF